jgi:hypothetical protein
MFDSIEAARASYRMRVKNFLQPDRDVASLRQMTGEGCMSKNNPHWGSTLDDFLREEGIRDAARAEAVIRVLARLLSREKEMQGIIDNR